MHHLLTPEFLVNNAENRQKSRKTADTVFGVFLETVKVRLIRLLHGPIQLAHLYCFERNA